jgi:hypothetical protein
LHTSRLDLLQRQVGVLSVPHIVQIRVPGRQERLRYGPRFFDCSFDVGTAADGGDSVTDCVGLKTVLERSRICESSSRSVSANVSWAPQFISFELLVDGLVSVGALESHASSSSCMNASFIPASVGEWMHSGDGETCCDKA